MLPASTRNEEKDGVMTAQEAKALAMRRRAQQRVPRLLNAKLRTIGIDRDYLDHQCEEKQEAKRQDAVEAAAYDEYEARMRDLVLARERAQFEEDSAMKAELQADWTEARETRRSREAAARVEASLPTDPESCGSASAQCLVGEDLEYDQRERAHDFAVQSWLAQQMEEKKLRGAEEKDEEQRYARYEEALRSRRLELETEEDSRRRDKVGQMSRENRDDALTIGDRKLEDKLAMAKLEAAEIRRQLTDPELCESTALGRSSVSSFRYRPDHFKGYSKGRVAQLLAQNQDIAKDRQSVLDEAKQRDGDYEKSQARLLELAREEEEHNACTHKTEALALQQKHADQREVERERLKKSKADRFGAIGPGYMDGFGRSDR